MYTKQLAMTMTNKKLKRRKVMAYLAMVGYNNKNNTLTTHKKNTTMSSVSATGKS
jgi:hypothetical protein